MPGNTARLTLAEEVMAEADRPPTAPEQANDPATDAVPDHLLKERIYELLADLTPDNVRAAAQLIRRWETP